MTDNATVQKPDANTKTTEGFGERSLAVSAETNTTAMAEKAKAAQNARFIMAIQRQRSWMDVRSRILDECRRPGFAAVARYRKPIGKGIEGPSIRFAEACLRYAGNMGVNVSTTFEDRSRRILSVQVIDYETNADCSAEITIEKTVERRKAEDRVVIATRKNTTGDTVFIVEATEDELLNKVNALVSKAARTLIMRLIPGDIVEEAQLLCVETMKTDAATDPTAKRKALCDAFAALGIMPSELERYLGHPLEASQPAEIVELRQVYATIRDGETIWTEVMASRGVAAAAGADGDGAKKSKTDQVADKVAAKKGAGAAAASAAGKPATREPGDDEELDR